MPLPATRSVAPYRSKSPEFNDSDTSPTKDENMRSKGFKEESDGDWNSNNSSSRNSRLQSIVAHSSDFGSPDPK